MKRNSKISAGLMALFAACLFSGCGKSGQADSKSGADPAKTQAEGERVGAGQAQHYQEMQQKKQPQNGSQ